MNTLLVRAAVALLFAALVLLAFQESKKPDPPAFTGSSLMDAGTSESSETPPPPPPRGGYRNQITLFTYLIIIAVAGGVMVLKWIIPAIGDRVADSFYSSPEASEQSPTHKAMALVAQGEYQKALAAFEKILAESPNDRFAVAEMARLHQDKLGDTDAAIAVLESAAAGDWPEDDKCFFLLRLADLHATHRSDFTRARDLLAQVQQEFPGSRHAANAVHKLREIEEAEFIASRGTQS
jgi:tetratricopeptide (TPR) repeat protein